VGEATKVGSEVKAFKVGEIVGVGCIHAKPVTHAHDISNIVVTYEIRVFFEGAQKEVFSSIFFKKL
jgi:hypothetical protein